MIVDIGSQIATVTHGARHPKMVRDIYDGRFAETLWSNPDTTVPGADGEGHPVMREYGDALLARAQADGLALTTHEVVVSDSPQGKVLEMHVEVPPGQTLADAHEQVSQLEQAAKAHAERHGLKLEDIPRIKGWGHRSAPISLETKLSASRGQALIFPHAALAMTEARERAGFADISAVDGLETHDCFTMAELMEYEAMGLTKSGEGARALEEGWTEKDGKLPVNPSGGLKSKGHPIGATGVSMHVLAAMQLQGEADEMQIDGAELVGTFNMGGAGVANYVSIMESLK